MPSLPVTEPMGCTYIALQATTLDPWSAQATENPCQALLPAW